LLPGIDPIEEEHRGMTSSAAAPNPPGSRTRPGIVLFVVCMAILIVPLGISGTSAALPEIGKDLGADLVPLQWVLNAYNVVAASLMMAVGSVADRLGRRRVFTAGTALYAVSLLIAAVANNIYLLDVARGLAGLGATGVMTAGTAILASSFEGAARTRAFALLGVTIGAGLALGPMSAGLISGTLGWRFVFVFHLLIVVTSMLGLPYVRETRDEAGGRVDLPGTVTFTVSLVLFTLAIIEGPQWGWGDGRILALLAGFVVLLAAFVVVERRQASPMFDLSLFLSARFVSANLLNIGISVGFVALLVTVPAYLIGAAGMSPEAAGLTMLLLTGPILVAPLVSGRLVASGVAPHTMLSIGMLIAAAGCAWLTAVTPDVTMAGLIGPLLAIGVGIGSMIGLLDGTAVSTVPPAKAGMAAGMFNTVRLASEAVAVVGMIAIVVSVVQSKLTDGLARFSSQGGDPGELANRAAGGDLSGVSDPALRAFLADAHTSGLRVALWACALFCAVAAVVAFRMLRERTQRAEVPVPQGETVLES
jgi:MFS family permease